MSQDGGPVGNGYLPLMLSDLLATSRRISEDMVTKEDLHALKAEFREITDNHEERLSDLESTRLPKWFWPSVAPVVGGMGTMMGWFLHHMGQR